MFLIIPCGHPVRVKVTLLKKWKKVTDIATSTILKFKMPKIKENDRLSIKFYSTNSDDDMQRSECNLEEKKKIMQT